MMWSLEPLIRLAITGGVASPTLTRPGGAPAHSPRPRLVGGNLVVHRRGNR